MRNTLANLKPLRHLFIQIKAFQTKKKIKHISKGISQTAAEGANGVKSTVSVSFHTFTDSIITYSTLQLFNCPRLHFLFGQYYTERNRKKERNREGNQVFVSTLFPIRMGQDPLSSFRTQAESKNTLLLRSNR